MSRPRPTPPVLVDIATERMVAGLIAHNQDPRAVSLEDLSDPTCYAIVGAAQGIAARGGAVDVDAIGDALFDAGRHDLLVAVAEIYDSILPTADVLQYAERCRRLAALGAARRLRDALARGIEIIEAPGDPLGERVRAAGEVIAPAIDAARKATA